MKNIQRRTRRVLGILLFMSFIFFQLTSAAGITKVGTSAATFLRIPVGGRSVGMGGAYVSMLDDPAALYWNPGALSMLKTNALIADHSPWLPGIDFDYFGIVLPLENIGTVGISTTFLHTQEMLITTYENQMGSEETFTASSMALGISYSRLLTDRFSIGGTVKYIRETIYNTSASGIAFDVGTIFITPLAGIRLGASISNFGSKMQMNGEDLNVRVDIAPDQEGNNQSVIGRLYTDEFDLPLTMRIGISGEVMQNDMVRLTLSADGINPNDNAQSVNVGGELGLFHDMLRVRLGYRDLLLPESEFGFSYGLGIHELALFGNVSVSTDYGYQKFIHLGYSNRFTVVLKF